MNSFESVKLNQIFVHDRRTVSAQSEFSCSCCF